RIYAVKDGFEFLGLDIKGSRVTVPEEAVGRFISYVREYARHRDRKQSDERIKHDLSRVNGWLAHYYRYIDRRALRRIYRGMHDIDAEGMKEGDSGELRKRPPSMFRIWSNILGRRDRELTSKQGAKTGPIPQSLERVSTTSVRPPQGVDVFAERGPVI
ncbi:MAG: hypothetical protein ACOYM3_34995, partial [Terrimicrobiaceae bacterium]